MRLKLTSFLVLLNVALFVYILLLERGEAPGQEESRAVIAPGVLAQAEAIRVSGNTVDHPWSARREGDRWLVEAPVEWPANPYAMQRLLDLLRLLRWETKFSIEEVRESGRSLEDYGINENSATVALSSPASEASIRIGSPTQVGSRLYLLSSDGEEIYVVQRSVLEGIDLSPESLIDQNVLVIPPFEIRSIYLQIGENSVVRVEIAREGDSWILRAPIRVAAASEAVEAALENLYQIQVQDFVDVPARTHGLNSPFLRMNLNGNNRQQTLLVGNIVDPDAIVLQRYAKLEARPVVFTVPAEPFEVWRTAQESLRDRRFLSFPPEEANAVEIRMGTHSLDLHRLESGNWQLVTAADDDSLRTVRADDSVIASLLQQLASLEALSFVSDAPSNEDLERFGFQSPQRSVTVRFRNDRSVTVRFGDFMIQALGDRRSNRIYATRDNSPSVYLTTASILAELPLNELHYRQRVAGSLPSGAFIERIVIRDRDSGTALLEAQRDAQQNWVNPDGSLGADALEAVRQLAQAFRHFPVRRFVSNDFSDPLRLDRDTSLPWAFELEAEVRLAGAGADELERRRYLLTERRGGITQFAGSAALDLVFTLPVDLIDALHPVLFNRPRPDLELNPEPAEPAPALPLEALPETGEAASGDDIPTSDEAAADEEQPTAPDRTEPEA